MYLKMAERNLRRHILRSTLALLGIIIGVMTISSLGILGSALKHIVLENFEGLADFVLVYPNPEEGYLYFTKRDVDKLKKLRYTVIPISLKTDLVYIRGENKKSYTKIYGVRKDQIRYLNLETQGKLGDTKVYVDSIFARNHHLEVGDRIILRNTSFRIAGIYNSSFFIVSPNSIILSQKTYRRFYGDNYSFLVIYVKDRGEIEKVKREIERIINKKERKVIVHSMDKILKSMENIIDKLSLFLMGIGGISLLVAGVGIGNIMLMSTVERTREIGIMKSIGASKRDILMLFLCESLILGVIGSVLGVLLSLILGYLVVHYLLNSYITLEGLVYSLLGFLFGVGISVVASLYPAYKAANLDPVKALKSE